MILKVWKSSTMPFNNIRDPTLFNILSRIECRGSSYDDCLFRFSDLCDVLMLERKNIESYAYLNDRHYKLIDDVLFLNYNGLLKFMFCSFTSNNKMKMDSISDQIVHYHLDFDDPGESKLDLIAQHTGFDDIRSFEDTGRGYEFDTFIDIVVLDKQDNIECEVRVYKKVDMYKRMKERFTDDIIFLALISPEYISFAAENIRCETEHILHHSIIEDNITNMSYVVSKEGLSFLKDTCKRIAHKYRVSQIINKELEMHVDNRTIRW